MRGGVVVSFVIELRAGWCQLTFSYVLFQDEIDHTPQANPVLRRCAIGDG